jgi:streptogramin lyase
MSTSSVNPPPIVQGPGHPPRRWWRIVLIVGLAIIAVPVALLLTVFGAIWFNQLRGPVTTTDCVKATDPSRPGAVSEYCLPTGTTPPHAMVVGPDGNFWFTDAYNGKLVKVTPQGAFTWVTAPVKPTGEPVPGIASGADGNLWYIADGQLGRVSPQGANGTVALPSGVVATSLTAGPDGNLWLSESHSTGVAAKKTADVIAKMTPSGQFTLYSLTPAGLTSAGGLTAGPDGNVWFVGTTSTRVAIGRITPTGEVAVFPVAVALQTTEPGYPACEPVDIGPCIAASNIGGLVTGSDGNLWFSIGDGRVGRITPTGVTNYFGALAGTGGSAIGAGPDGKMWLSAHDNSGGPLAMARMTGDGAVTKFTLPHDGNVITITAGPDGGVWFLLVKPEPSAPSPTQRLVRVTP